MNLEDIILNEISQSQKDKYCMIPLTGGTYSSQKHRKQEGGYRAGRRMGSQYLMEMEFQFGKMKKF